MVKLWDTLSAWATTNPLGVTIFGTVAAAAIIGIWSRLPKLGVPVRRFFKVLSTVRITTTTRMTDARKGAEKRGFALATEQMKPLIEARSAVERSPKIPSPEPRWAISRAEGFDVWQLSNRVPSSTARNVRVESDNDFTVLDAGHWDDLSGEASGTFKGRMSMNGSYQGVQFMISWYNDRSQRMEQTFWYDAEREVPDPFSGRGFPL